MPMISSDKLADRLANAKDQLDRITKIREEMLDKAFQLDPVIHAWQGAVEQLSKALEEDHYEPENKAEPEPATAEGP